MSDQKEVELCSEKEAKVRFFPLNVEFYEVVKACRLTEKPPSESNNYLVWTDNCQLCSKCGLPRVVHTKQSGSKEKRLYIYPCKTDAFL